MAKANPFRFSTKYQDDETDLLYYGYRYYNASTGRWLSRDFSEGNGVPNLYSITANDTVGNFDVLGFYAFVRNSYNNRDGGVPKRPTYSNGGPSYSNGRPTYSSGRPTYSNPYPPYPPPNTVDPKKLAKYDCSCCDNNEQYWGLRELKRRFYFAQAVLAQKGIQPKAKGNASCFGANNAILGFMSPIPRCWICFLDRRFDQYAGGWDENYIHCWTKNNIHVQKEVIFDWFESAYYQEGDGVYEDIGNYYKHHPYPASPAPEAWRPVHVDCSKDDPKWRFNMNSLNSIMP